MNPFYVVHWLLNSRGGVSEGSTHRQISVQTMHMKLSMYVVAQAFHKDTSLAACFLFVGPVLRGTVFRGAMETELYKHMSSIWYRLLLAKSGVSSTSELQVLG